MFKELEPTLSVTVNGNGTWTLQCRGTESSPAKDLGTAAAETGPAGPARRCNAASVRGLRDQRRGRRVGGVGLHPAPAPRPALLPGTRQTRALEQPR